MLHPEAQELLTGRILAPRAALHVDPEGYVPVRCLGTQIRRSKAPACTKMRTTSPSVSLLIQKTHMTDFISEISERNLIKEVLSHLPGGKAFHKTQQAT